MSQDQSHATYSENGPCTTLMRTSRLRLKSVFSKKMLFISHQQEEVLQHRMFITLEVSVTRTSRKAALSANRLSEYSSSLLEYNVVYQESTVITCAKNRTCNLCSSNVQARVTSCVRQPATARKWREVMQMPLGVYSWDPRNHVSQKRAHWRTWQIRLHMLHEAQMSLWNNANRILK